MPLEVHDYLVSQGWGGKGTGLRQGAISRPLAIPQKKTLAGLGKDRDEAFPFWDHLFSAAAKSIQLKCLSDDEKEESDETSPSTAVPLRKTKTGIFSTRRPVGGTPADSGTTTPNEVDTDSPGPRLSLLALAKRDAAKRHLYAQFFRGPVLGPETIAEEERRLAELVQEAFDKQNPGVESITITEHIEVKMADESMVIDLEVSKSSKKKRKGKDTTDDLSKGDVEDEEERKERKRRRKEEKRKKEDKETAKLNRRKEKKEKREREAITEPVHLDVPSSSKHTGEENDEEKSERRRRKEEKRKLKALLRHQKNIAIDSNPVSEGKVLAEAPQLPSPHKEKSSSRTSSDCIPLDDAEPVQQDRRKKKKRKREDNPDDSN